MCETVNVRLRTDASGSSDCTNLSNLPCAGKSTALAMVAQSVKEPPSAEQVPPPAAQMLPTMGHRCYHAVFKHGWGEGPDLQGDYRFTQDGGESVRTVGRQHVCFAGCTKDHGPYSKDAEATNWSCPWYLASQPHHGSNVGATSFAHIYTHATERTRSVTPSLKDNQRTVPQPIMQCPSNAKMYTLREKSYTNVRHCECTVENLRICQF
jgi:hypothetical protein